MRNLVHRLARYIVRREIALYRATIERNRLERDLIGTAAYRAGKKAAQRDPGFKCAIPPAIAKAYENAAAQNAMGRAEAAEARLGEVNKLLWQWVLDLADVTGEDISDVMIQHKRTCRETAAINAAAESATP